MERLTPYDTPDGVLDVSDRDLEAFRADYPDAQRLTVFDDGAGGEVEVLDRDLDAFRAEHPEARRLSAVGLADGSTVDVAEGDERAFLRDYREQPEYAADREAARGAAEAAAAPAESRALAAARGFAEGAAEGAAQFGREVWEGAKGAVLGAADLAAEAARGAAALVPAAASGVAAAGERTGGMVSWLGEALDDPNVRALGDQMRASAGEWRAAFERGAETVAGSDPDGGPTAGRVLRRAAGIGADLAALTATGNVLGAYAELAGISAKAVEAAYPVMAMAEAGRRAAYEAAVESGFPEEAAQAIGVAQGLVTAAQIAIMGRLGLRESTPLAARAFQTVGQRAAELARREGVNAAAGFVGAVAGDAVRQISEGAGADGLDYGRMLEAGAESAAEMAVLGAAKFGLDEVRDAPARRAARQFDESMREMRDEFGAWRDMRDAARGDGPRALPANAAEASPAPEAPEAQPAPPPAPRDAASALALTPDQARAAAAAKAAEEAAPTPAERALLARPEAPAPEQPAALPAPEAPAPEAAAPETPPAPETLPASAEAAPPGAAPALPAPQPELPGFEAPPVRLAGNPDLAPPAMAEEAAARAFGAEAAPAPEAPALPAEPAPGPGPVPAPEGAGSPSAPPAPEAPRPRAARAKAPAVPKALRPSPENAARAVGAFVSKDATRPVLLKPWHDKEAGVVVATDGRVLIATRHGFDKDAPPPDATPPRWRQVVPDYSKGDWRGAPVATLRLDPAAVNARAREAAKLARAAFGPKANVAIAFDAGGGKVLLSAEAAERVSAAMAANGIAEARIPAGVPAPLLAANADTTIVAMPLRGMALPEAPSRTEGGADYGYVVVDAATGRVLAAPEWDGKRDSAMLEARRADLGRSDAEARDLGRKAGLWAALEKAWRPGIAPGELYAAVPEFTVRDRRPPFGELPDAARAMLESLAGASDLDDLALRAGEMLLNRDPGERAKEARAIARMEGRVAAQREIDRLMAAPAPGPVPAPSGAGSPSATAPEPAPARPARRAGGTLGDAAPASAGIGDDVLAAIEGRDIPPPPGGGTPPPGGAGRDFSPNPADDPDFNRLPFSLADMVAFVRRMGGKTPRAADSLAGGRHVGEYRFREGAETPGEIWIDRKMARLTTPAEDAAMRAAAEATAANPSANPDGLSADEIFAETRERVVQSRLAGGQKLARAVLAHEIGHMVDSLPAPAKLPKGNIFAHIANYSGYLKKTMAGWLGGPEALSKRDREALRREAERQVREEMGPLARAVIREEPVFATVGITPDDILDIMRESAGAAWPELADWFARLDTQAKREILSAALRGAVDARAAHFGRTEQVGTRKIYGNDPAAVRARNEAVRRRFGELLRAETERRHALEVESFKAEARDFIAWWRGEQWNTPEEARAFEEYYNAPAEMYAELFGAWLCNPDALKARAPQVYQAFSGWSAARPGIDRAYREMTDAIARGTATGARRADLRAQWSAEAEAAERRERREAEKLTGREKIDWIATRLYRKSAALRGAARRADPDGAAGLAGRVEDAIGSFNYVGTAAGNYYADVNNRVLKPLDAAGLTAQDLGEYLFHRRVEGERAEMLNAGGFDSATSRQALDEMRAEMGDARFAALEGAAADFRALYEESCLRPLVDSGMFGDKAAEHLMENAFYATFSVKKGREASGDPLRDAVERRCGEDGAAFLMGQKGSLEAIRNPFSATVAKGLQAIRLKRRNDLARAVVETAMREGHAVEVERRWDPARKRMVYRDARPTERQSVVGFLDGGQYHKFVVPKALAALLDEGTQDPGARAFMRWLRAATNQVGGFFTRDSLAFQSVAERRDIASLYQHLPGAKMTLVVSDALVGNVPFLPSFVVRPALGYMPAGLFRHVFRSGDPMEFYQPADEVAKSIVDGAPNDLARRMLERDILIADQNYAMTDFYGDLAAESDLGRAMRRAGQDVSRRVLGEPDPKGLAGKAWEAVAKGREIVQKAGERRELRIKIAGMMFLDAHHPDMPEWRKRQIVRNLAGSPDFLEGGSWKGGLSMGRMFINPAIQGTAAHLDRAFPRKEGARDLPLIGRRRPDSEFAARWARTTGVPTFLRWAAASGLASAGVAALIRALRGAEGLGDDDPREAAGEAQLKALKGLLDGRKAMFDAIPDYHKQNWIVDPVCWLDRDKGVVLAWRAPFEDTDAWAARMEWATLDWLGRETGLTATRTAQDSPAEVAGEFAVDWLPVSPILAEMFGPLVFEGLFGRRYPSMSGSRMNRVLPDAQLREPWQYRVGPTAQAALNKSPIGSWFGGFGQQSRNGVEAPDDRTAATRFFEALRHTPGLARNILVTDRGWAEEKRQIDEAETVRRDAMRARMRRAAARIARLPAGETAPKSDWDILYGPTGDAAVDAWRQATATRLLQEAYAAKSGQKATPEYQEYEWLQGAKSDRARAAVRDLLEERRRVAGDGPPDLAPR